MIFWVAAGVFLLVSLIALLLLSMRNSNDQGRKPAYFWGAIALTSVISLLIYKQLGAEQELSLRTKMNNLAADAANNPESSYENAIELVRALEDATQTYPDKPEYWYLLATQQISLERYSEAADAYAGAYRLVPEDISLLARQTEAEYLASEYRLTEPVQGLIDQVLAVEPNNSIVMGILGITAYRGGKFDIAVRFWERALSVMPPMSTEADTMRSSIAQAKTLLAQQTGEVASEETVDADPGASLTVNVSLAEGLSFPPDTTLFVFVRQAGGPPMPVVVERTVVGSLPAQFLMDDSKVMIQGRVLADFPSLEVVARVSLSGQPTASSGDYQAVMGPISMADIDGPLSLVISDLVP